MIPPASGLVDAHVHLYPQEVSADPAGWAARMGEPLWAEMVLPRGGRRVRQGWADAERLLRDMDAAGVERAVLLGWYWERPSTCAWQNRYYAGCVRAHPDRLTAFATVQAEAGERALDEMRRARDEGLSGLGEMCPWAFGMTPLGGFWPRVFEEAMAMGWPVNLHVTDPAGRRYPGRVETPLGDVVALAEAMPELRLVLAHFGGGLLFHELNPHCRRVLGNAVYDTAAAPLLYRGEVFAAAVEAVGAERLLFGSDYPLLVRPSEQTEPDLRRVVADVRAAGLAPSDEALVLVGNARRVFGLPG
jgi:predicted TIM-barrel fold metal-dependent hydrolase